MQKHQEKLVVSYRKFDASDFKGGLPSVEQVDKLLGWCSDKSNEISHKAKLQLLYNLYSEDMARNGGADDEGGSSGGKKKKRGRKKSIVTNNGAFVRVSESALGLYACGRRRAAFTSSGIDPTPLTPLPPLPPLPTLATLPHRPPPTSL